MGLIDVDCIYGLTIAPVIERGWGNNKQEYNIEYINNKI